MSYPLHLAAPLVYKHLLHPYHVIAQTTITGEARTQAVISLMDGSLTVWSGTLHPTIPQLIIPYPLQVGPLSLQAGTTFILKTPTPLELGHIVMEATVTTAVNPVTPLRIILALWPYPDTNS